MKVVIPDLFQHSSDRIIIWVDKDGDINFEINMITVCIKQAELNAVLKFVNQNPETK